MTAPAAPPAAPLGRVAFDFSAVQPPAPFYVYPGSRLICFISNIATSVTIRVRLRIISPDGGARLLERDFVPTSDGSINTFSSPMPEGFVLDAIALRSAGSNNWGQTYVQFGIAVGEPANGLARYVIFGTGYVSNFTDLFWPGGVYQDMRTGPGAVKTVVGSVPAAGADISETIPAQRRQQLLALSAQLTTAVAAANRQVRINMDDGANKFFATGSTVNQAASLAFSYNLGAGLPGQVNITGTAIQIGIPLIFLVGGSRIMTATAAIQAADQWTAPVYTVLDWLDLVT